jgi:2'-5' RNA ligase
MTKTIDSYRTFIAIELSPEIRRRIQEHIDQLRFAFPEVRASWLREDNLHLTLKFLGDVPIARIPALSDAAAEAARSNESFDVIVSECGSFPPRGQPNVLWIGVGSVPPAVAGGFAPPASASGLQSLHVAVENECAEAGFERDPRPFHPHLTIARLGKSRGSRALAEHHKQLSFAPQTFTVSELIVFRSELSSEGSKHTMLSRHEMKPA